MGMGRGDGLGWEEGRCDTYNIMSMNLNFIVTINKKYTACIKELSPSFHCKMHIMKLIRTHS